MTIALAYIIIIILFILLIFVIYKGAKLGNESISIQMDPFNSKGHKLKDLHELGSYVGGHPDINDLIESVSFVKYQDNLELYKYKTATIPLLIATIPTESIEDIHYEDASSLEKKITLGRILLVGVFALAWKKNKKKELSFVVIEWKNGKFKNSITFSFEGKDSVQKANSARNELIKFCN